MPNLDFAGGTLQGELSADAAGPEITSRNAATRSREQVKGIEDFMQFNVRLLMKLRSLLF